MKKIIAAALALVATFSLSASPVTSPPIRSAVFHSASGPIAVLFGEAGNSHDGGRANATGSETDWDARVYQWTQAGALQQMRGTSRLNLDQQVGGSFSSSTTLCASACNTPSTSKRQISPSYWFAQEFIAANPTVSRVVFVTHSKNATGFCGGFWSVPGAATYCTVQTPASLADFEARYNAARTALLAQGYTVIPGGVFYHSADPDYDAANNHDAHRALVDGAIAHMRANLVGFGNAPIMFGGGMTYNEMNGVGFTDYLGNAVTCSAQGQNDINYQSNLNSVNKRNAYTAVFDQVNVRYGYSTGIPAVPMTDCIHEDYTGVQTLGHLRYLALARAKANSAPRTPFDHLSFASSLVGFWDFRSASTADWSGNGNTLTRIGSSPAIIRYDGALNEDVWNRPTVPSSGSNRGFQVPVALTASYSKVFYFKPMNDLTADYYFWGDTNSTTASRHYLQFLFSSQSIVAGQNSTVSRVAIPVNITNFSTSSYHLIVVTYDAATTTMKLYLDSSTAGSTNMGVSAITSLNGGYLMARNGTIEASPTIGSAAYAMSVNRALTSAEIAELITANTHLLD